MARTSVPYFFFLADSLSGCTPLSINKIRQSFETKGCQVALIICGALLVLGLVLPQSCAGLFANQNAASASTDVVVAKVGSRDITMKQVAAAFEAQQQQFAQFAAQLSEPDIKFTIFSSALKQTVDSALMAELASRKGISLDDVTVLTAYEKQLDDAFEQTKADLIAQKKVPATATAADIDKALSAQLGGKTVAEYRTEQLDMIKKGLSDPATRDGVVGQIVPALVNEGYMAQANVTEEELKASYDSLVFDAIPFNDLKQALADREAKAEAAYGEIEGGKDFAAVKKAVAPNAPTATVALTRTEIESNPALAPLLDLKPGETAEPVLREGSPVIYRLSKIENKLPADFESTKATLLNFRRQQVAGQQLTKDLDELKKSSAVVWQNPTMETFYKISEVASVATIAEQREKYLEYAEALAVPPKDPAQAINPEWVALGRYFAINQAYSISKPEQQKEMKEQLVDAAQEALEFSESGTLRLKLAQLYADLGDNENLADTLRVAAQNNVGFDAGNQQTYAEITRLKKKYQDDKKLTPEQAAEIQKALDDWLKEKAEYEKEQAEFRKEQEAAAKELDEADRKAAEEEAKKAGANAKPTETAPKTGG